MLLAGQTQSKFRRFAGVSSAKNAADVQSTCARIGRNIARQEMAVCKSIGRLPARSRITRKARLIASWLRVML